MAEHEKEPSGDEAEKDGAEDLNARAPKGLSTKLILIIVLGGLVVIGGAVGAALYFTGAFSKKEAVTDKEAEGSHEEGGKAEKSEKGDKSEKTEKGDKKEKVVFFPLGDLLVNLSGEGKRPNYLKVKISLELADEKDSATIESLKPRIIDNFQIYLRELRVEDLRGSAGLYRLREALLLRVTEAAQPVRIRDVLFQEMLIQ